MNGRDFRRTLFRKQVELLAILSPGWAQREALNQQEILKRHPFDDASDLRVRLTADLRARGHTSETAWRMACERHPLPGDGAIGGADG